MPTKTVNLLILILGLIVLALVGGIIAVILNDGNDVANQVLPLVGLAGPAIGALVTLLTRPPTDTAGVAAQVIANQPPPVDLSKLEGGAKALLEAVQATGAPTTSQPTPAAVSSTPNAGTDNDIPLV